MNIVNWGGYPSIDAEIHSFRSEKELATITNSLHGYIPRGLGRCYGDSSLAGNIISTLKFNHILHFDQKTGIVVCEAGTTLKELLDVFVPRGWFLPVTPGTKFITVGGALASDVHGKNHHCEGSFSDHTLWLDIQIPDGSVIRCSPDDSNSSLFHATCGGMGLTGIILRACFRLKPIQTSFIQQEQFIAQDLGEILDLFIAHESYAYSMAWIDCLSTGKKRGRSVMMAGDHYAGDNSNSEPLQVSRDPRINVPFYAPGFLLNSLSIKLFNATFYRIQKLKSRRSILHYEPFFYPLDSVLNWNRLYGKRGFLQYQFVLPLEESKKGLINILKEISSRGEGSFLAVLKLFGNGNRSLIGFPEKGFTLALDFPIKSHTIQFMNELDNIVADHGGKIYLTKDARMSGSFFRKTYRNTEEFMELKSRIDPEHKIQSLQSQRLGL